MQESGAGVGWSEWIPTINVLVGGVLVIAGGAINAWFSDLRRTSKERKAIAHAFRGEIGAILDIIAKRNYVAGFRAHRDRIRATGEVEIVTFQAKRDYFPVYRHHCQSLGLLVPQAADDVARFYALGTALLEDMERLSEMKADDFTAEEAAAAYDQVVSFLEEMLEVGAKLTAGLHRKSSNYALERSRGAAS